MPVTPVASSPGRSCETRVGSCRSSNGSSEPSRSPDSPGLWSARSLGSAAIVDSARTTSIGCKHRRLCSTLPPSVLCSIAWHRHETSQTPSYKKRASRRGQIVMRLFLRLMHYLLHPVAGTLFSLGWKSGQRMIPPSPTAKAPGPASASLFKDNLALLYQKDRLPLLYQGLLTGAVRVQVGRQPVLNADALRKRTKAALEDVERDAVVAGYDRSDVRDTHFAVVAFLDAVVLNSVEPMRAEWERQTLQQDLFGQADAGIVFFERLNHFLSRRDSLHLA